MGCNCSRTESTLNPVNLKGSVGKKYQELPNQYSGEGIKRTVAWQAVITPSELKAKRNEFWRSRTTGNRTCWMQLKQAIEADSATAGVLLEMAGIFPESGSIRLCYDSEGNTYEIPVFVVNDPVKFLEEGGYVPPPKKERHEEDITVKLRGINGQDTKIQINTGKLVSELKAQYSQENENPEGNIRLFFGGKEMKDNQEILNYGVENEMVIQVYFFKKA